MHTYEVKTRGQGSFTYTTTFALDASAVKDANGDLVITDNATGETAVWVRQ